jgi:hypothetical protein
VKGQDKNDLLEKTKKQTYHAAACSKIVPDSKLQLEKQSFQYNENYLLILPFISLNNESVSDIL